MSRIARKPIAIPAGVTVEEKNGSLNVSGPKGKLGYPIHNEVSVKVEDNVIHIAPKGGSTKTQKSIPGTACALIKNIIHGVTKGFEKKLQLVGVGYRAKLQGNKLELSLGFSHPVVYDVPDGVKIEVPSNTELSITGIDKQIVGQVAADIRRIRPPEVYKGKGVRYAEEHIKLKETKKK